MLISHYADEEAEAQVGHLFRVTQVINKQEQDLNSYPFGLVPKLFLSLVSLNLSFLCLTISF
jgi:hypothetical protein